MVCTIWTEVSGELSKVRQALDGKNVKKWSELEDMALTEPEDSIEF